MAESISFVPATLLSTFQNQAETLYRADRLAVYPLRGIAPVRLRAALGRIVAQHLKGDEERQQTVMQGLENPKFVKVDRTELHDRRNSSTLRVALLGEMAAEGGWFDTEVTYSESKKPGTRGLRFSGLTTCINSETGGEKLEDDWRALYRLALDCGGLNDLDPIPLDDSRYERLGLGLALVHAVSEGILKPLASGVVSAEL